MPTGSLGRGPFFSATMTLIPAMGKNEPITQIVDLFDKPLSSAYTEDAKLAFEVYGEAIHHHYLKMIPSPLLHNEPLYF